MNLSFEVMLPPRGAEDYTQSANHKWKVLSVVAVYPLKQVDEVGMPCTGYIHVTHMPEPKGWKKLNEDEKSRRLNAKFAGPWNDGDELIERRKVTGNAEVLTQLEQRVLLRDRQLTIPWSRFKVLMRNIAENRSVSDEDLE